VIVGPSHDTAAAVAGVPAAEGFAFVRTGTWALVGVELPAPVITEAARRAGFSDEAGVDGTTRFLRNVTGFWLLQECVREWRAEGRSVDLDSLTRAAGRVHGLRAIVDVQDPAFLVPGGMTQRIIRACLRGSGVVLSGDAEILRCILDSLAVAIRHAVQDAVRLTARPVRTVHVVGGGVANPLFCQLVADACQLPVVAGPVEAAGRRALHLPFSRVEIVTADLGQDAVALGGATLPIARLLTAGAVAPRHPEKPRRIRSVTPG